VEESAGFIPGQALEYTGLDSHDPLIDALEQFTAGSGGRAEHLPSILTTATLEQALLYESIDESSNPRGLFDHLAGDLQRRKAGVSGGGNDPQDGVLLRREAVGRTGLGNGTAEELADVEQGRVEVRVRGIRCSSRGTLRFVHDKTLYVNSQHVKEIGSRIRAGDSLA